MLYVVVVWQHREKLLKKVEWRDLALLWVAHSKKQP
jgi:hypothetical protein